MRRRNTTSRANQRQKMLSELASDETVCGTIGNAYSRAAEAVDAMRRIRDGTYGICADCDKKIPRNSGNSCRTIARSGVRGLRI